MLSPDGKVAIVVSDSGGLSYSASLDGHEVVAWSRFGIIADGVDLGGDAKLGKSKSSDIHETYATFGGHTSAVNECREATVEVRSASGGDYELDVRAYNDGVALRSQLPARKGRMINGESTEWKLPGDPTAWYQTDFGSYEGLFKNTRLQDLRRQQDPIADYLQPTGRRLRPGDGSQSGEL